MLLNHRKHDIFKIVVIETEANDDKTSSINKNSEKKSKKYELHALHTFTNVRTKKRQEKKHIAF